MCGSGHWSEDVGHLMAWSFPSSDFAPVQMVSEFGKVAESNQARFLKKRNSGISRERGDFCICHI